MLWTDGCKGYKVIKEEEAERRRQGDRGGGVEVRSVGRSGWLNRVGRVTALAARAMWVVFFIFFDFDYRVMFICFFFFGLRSKLFSIADVL